MRLNIRNLLVVGVLLALILTCPALAEKQSAMVAPQLIRPIDFRIEVDTNKDVYYNRDVFILTVKLLNNSPFSLLIADDKRLPDGSDEEIVDSALLEGFLDGSEVDVAFMPSRPQVILGYATLTPLGLISHPYEGDIQIWNQNRIILPLFGHSEIPAYSTTIISTTNVLVATPYITQPIRETDGGDDIQIVPVANQYVFPSPGSYLLNCTIRLNGSPKVAKAQKIIRIGTMFE